MATLLENANRIKTSKENIRQAIVAKGVTVPTTASLDTYNNYIANIPTPDIKVFSKNCNITDGTWTGATLSNSSWVNISSATRDSSWTYNFSNFTIDVSKIKFISALISETTNWIRMGRGFAQNSATQQYQYFPSFQIYGNKDVSNSAAYGGISGDWTSTVHAAFVLDNNCIQDVDTRRCGIYVRVYSNRIVFDFPYVDRAMFFIKSTTPKFAFTIGYTP